MDGPKVDYSVINDASRTTRNVSVNSEAVSLSVTPKIAKVLAKQDVIQEIRESADQAKQIHDKYTIVPSFPRKIRNGVPLNPSCPSTYCLQLTTTWDRGSRSVRERILLEFIQSNDKKTGPQLERELGNGASLFLTRISAWLRLTYLLSYDLALQIRAINVFISASSGSRFLAEFLEVGGVLTVLEIIVLHQATENDKAEALRLLQSVANNGRKYKEFVCESFGVRQVIECLSKSRSEITQDYARNLLVELGTGNPKFQVQVFKGLQSLLTSQAVSPTAQQMCGQALRILLPNISNVSTNFVESAFGILKSPHIQVQYEGYELIRFLLNERKALQDQIISQLVAILRHIVDDSLDDSNEGDRHRRNKMDTKVLVGQWGGVSAEQQKEKDAIISGYVQQAYCAKQIVAKNRDLAEKMIKMHLVSGLLNVISNSGHTDSQKYAANTLVYLVETFGYVHSAIRENMGTNFLDLLENKQDTFYRELNKDQIRYLRRNNMRIKKENTHHLSSLEESDSGSDSSEDDGESSPFTMKQAFPSSKEETAPISVKEAKVAEPSTIATIKDGPQLTEQDIAEAYENKDDEPDDVEHKPVGDLYTPIVQTDFNTIFAGNKYVIQRAENDGNSKFVSDLEKFKASTKSKRRDGKKEFKVANPPELDAKLNATKTDPKLFNKETASKSIGNRARVSKKGIRDSISSQPNTTNDKKSQQETEGDEYLGPDEDLEEEEEESVDEADEGTNELQVPTETVAQPMLVGDVQLSAEGEEARQRLLKYLNNTENADA